MTRSYLDDVVPEASEQRSPDVESCELSAPGEPMLDDLRGRVSMAVERTGNSISDQAMVSASAGPETTMAEPALPNGACVDEAEREARLIWAHLAEPRDAKAVSLIASCGYGEALEAVRAEPHRWANFSSRLDVLDLEEQLRRYAVMGVRVVVPGDDEWPSGVDDLAEVPHVLFVHGAGHLAELAERSVALVGARAATHYGQRTAAEIALGVGNDGVNVVSGGAYGIDAAAHRGALAGDAATICVVAGGVERAYPAPHENCSPSYARKA